MFNKETFKIAIQHTPGVATAQAEDAERMVRKKLALEEHKKKIVTAKQRTHHYMKISGKISITTFLLAYALVMFYVCRIW